MFEELRANLMDLGLSQKEADVYLAMLELGSASVQDIAKKADINRATAYVIIAALQRRGLASTMDNGKKVMFAAENPEKLVGMVVTQLSGIQAKHRKLESALPQLLALFNLREDKPKVRFYEGSEAITANRLRLTNMHVPIWEACSVDEKTAKFDTTDNEKRIEMTMRVKGRVLFAIKPGFTPPYFNNKGVEARVLDYERYPFSGVCSVAGDCLAILSVTSPGLNIFIEDKSIADIFRALYEAAWLNAKPWMPPPGWGPQSGV